MCRQHDSDSQHVDVAPPSAASSGAAAGASDPFPWDVGVFDAHCHPTDTMPSVASIPRMKARGLAVMSTRSQDQDLVSEVAGNQGVQGPDELFASQSPERRFVPCFGWHPWFSYQLYDDTDPAFVHDGTPQGKIAHYDKILTPSPSSADPSFAEGLEDPRSLSQFLAETRARLEQHPFALVGEIGLDKAFRLPESWTTAGPVERDDGLTPGGREGRRLSPHRVSLEHQTAILTAQLKLAGEMDRAVSVHGVQVHGGVYNAVSACWKGHEKEVLSRREKRRIAAHAEDFSSDSETDSDDDDEGRRPAAAAAVPTKRAAGTGSKKPYPPRICLHSYSGPVNILKQYTDPSVPAAVFFSYSVCVNWDLENGGGKNQKTIDAIRATPDDRILVESDLHTAGDPMDDALERICRIVCDIKGWPLREGVERLARNWRHYVFGTQ